MALKPHEMKALAIELAAAMPNDLKSSAGTISASIDGVADVLTSMVGEYNDMDGRLYACSDLLRRLSAELDQFA